MQSRSRIGSVQDTIVEFLRGRIIDGKLKPGDRLPSRVEIEEQFSTSTVTVQRAFDRLIEYGFVTTRIRQGTFVAFQPPHLSRYVIAFPGTFDDPGWVRYWTVLMEVARRKQRESGLSIAAYTGIDPGCESGDYRRLLEDIETRRLAGVIFATSPHMVDGTPIMKTSDLPRVAIMEDTARRDVIRVTLDGRAFFKRAVDYLASCQRKRIAMITVPGIEGSRLDYFRSQLREYGMTCHPHWIQTAHQSEPQWAANLARLLMSGKKKESPDGLIITDDNLVEHASLGVVEAGRRLPEDLDIVAHCNFPAPAPRMVPVQRLGYDMRRVLNVSIDLIDRQRRDKRRPSPVTIPAVFESELETHMALPIVVESGGGR